MMKKYVSLDKQSKKAQKEYYASMRQTWGGLNPMTRTVPNGKAYNRKKEKRDYLKSADCSGKNGMPIFASASVKF